MDAVVMNASSSLTGEAYITATVTQCSHVYKRPVNGHWAASWSLGSIMVIGQQIMVKPVSDQSEVLLESFIFITLRNFTIQIRQLLCFAFHL